VVLQFFQWYQQSPVARATQASWFALLIEVLHAVGLTILTGAIVLVSLRLLGASMTSRPVSEVAGELWSWSVIGLGLQLASGAVLFSSQTVQWYGSVPFSTKMTLLLVGILFHFTVYRMVTRRDDLRPLTYRLTGGFALLIWFGVGISGRAITIL
jgi:hypothetical protein